MLDVTDITLPSTISAANLNGKLLLVDFWAVWCVPCRAMLPVLEAIEQVFGDRVTFVKMNVDDNPDTAADLGVNAVPTLMLFKNGKPVDQLVGAVGRDKLDAFIKKHL